MAVSDGARANDIIALVEFIARKPPFTMARTAANIGGEVEPVHHHNAKRSTCQETFRAYKAAIFLDSGVANTDRFESSVLAVPVTLCKSNHSMGV